VHITLSVGQILTRGSRSVEKRLPAPAPRCREGSFTFGVRSGTAAFLRQESVICTSRDTPQQNVVLIDAATLWEACSEDAELPFGNVLHLLTSSDPSVTAFVLEVTARCLQCRAETTEKTLVEPT